MFVGGVAAIKGRYLLAFWIGGWGCWLWGDAMVVIWGRAGTYAWERRISPRDIIRRDIRDIVSICWRAL